MQLTGQIKTVNFDFLTGDALLTLKVNEKDAIKQGCDELKNVENLSIEIKPYRKKRSLDSNAYCWVLCEKLAQKLGITKEEVYRSHIKDIGVFRQVEIDEKAVDTLIHSWLLHGVGWIAEKVDYAQHDGFVLVNLYYGSSTYNTKQMSRLINNIVQDCKEQGIQTATPEEINNMLSLWKEAR